MVRGTKGGQRCTFVHLAECLNIPGFLQTAWELPQENTRAGIGEGGMIPVLSLPPSILNAVPPGLSPLVSEMWMRACVYGQKMVSKIPAPSSCFLINYIMLRDQGIQQALSFRLMILSVLSWVSGFLWAFYCLRWNTFDHCWLTFLSIGLSISPKIKQRVLSEFFTQDIGSVVTETLHTFLGLLLFFLSFCFGFWCLLLCFLMTLV